MKYVCSPNRSLWSTLRLRVSAFAASALTLALLFAGSSQGQHRGPADFANASGVSRTVSTTGTIDTSNPFFLSLGTNGRACVTCHQPRDNWSITPEGVRSRFDATQGLDPLFRRNDGAVSPLADVSTIEKRREAYGLLLNKGLIRVGIGIPQDAEFELANCDDPYGFASAKELSLFRRPLPATNLRFISAVMWDGRETIQPMAIQPQGGNENANVAARLFDLMHQSNSATRGHAEGLVDLTDEQKQQIVALEMSTCTAQIVSNGAGILTAQQATGGPAGLIGQPFYIGINDNVADPQGPFNPASMQLFECWANTGSPHRQAIARGERLFTSREFEIKGVKGLNDNSYFGKPEVVVGTCTTCHNAPNVGNHSLSVPLDIGLTDASRRTPDLPLYTLLNKSTGQTIQTTDPGRALITGKWGDIGKFKGPVLRGLAGRAPYFHNGSAATLEDAVDFYDTRFKIRFTDREKSDLVEFLKAL